MSRVLSWRNNAGGVETHRVGDDLDDAPVADLVAVAERAVDDVAAPVLGEAVDVGELVDETGGGEHPSGDQRMATGELDAEAVVVGAGDVDGAAGEDLTSVAADLLTTDGGQLRRRKPLVTEVAVHVGGGGVARLAASTTITDRRWRPSWRAAASPAADPPMTATSQCRSTVRGAWLLMTSTIRSIPKDARTFAIFARAVESGQVR